MTMNAARPSHRALGAIGALLALALAATACGGDDSSASVPSADVDDVGDTSASSPDDEPSEPVAAVANGPINGLVISQPAFGLGLFTIDRDSGAITELSTSDNIDFVERNDQPLATTSAAFSLGYTTRDGQEFAKDVSLVRIDLATGEVSKLAELGFETETDDSEDRFSFDIQAASDEIVIVQERSSGEDDPIIRTFDPVTGEELASFGAKLDEASDSATCSANASVLYVLDDGRLLGDTSAGTGGDPLFVDPATGDVTLAVPCEVTKYASLDQFVDVSQFADVAVAREGDQWDDESIAKFLSWELEPGSDLVVGDGDLWWVADKSPTVENLMALQKTIVRFDLETGVVEEIFSLGPRSGEFIDCEIGGDTCEIGGPQLQLAFMAGRLVMVDARENTPILILDPATGIIEELVLELGDGVDYTEASLVPGDKEAVWVEVKRMTITKDDDTGRTASGPRYFERIDPTTATVTVSVTQDDS